MKSGRNKNIKIFHIIHIHVSSGKRAVLLAQFCLLYRICEFPQKKVTTTNSQNYSKNTVTNCQWISTTTTNESLLSDDSSSNDTLSALVKKSRDLSHLQKNLLTKSRTRERQTKSTWNHLFLKLITYICNKVLFCNRF